MEDKKINGDIKEFVCNNKDKLLPVVFYLLDEVAKKKWWLQIGMGAVKKILQELVDNFCSHK